MALTPSLCSSCVCLSLTPLEKEEDRVDFQTSYPPSCPWTRTPALSRLLRALQQFNSMDDGVIPGVLAYAARADWSGLEFPLLRDSRHTFLSAETGLDWWMGRRAAFSRSMDLQAWQAYSAI